MNTLKAVATDAWHSLHSSFNLLWSKVADVLPSLMLVLVVLGAGLVISAFLSDKISLIVKKIKLDVLLDKLLAPVSKFTGAKVSASSIIGASIKWFLIAVVLIAALDLADLNEVVSFFNQALGYIPRIFVAALILLVGALLANLAGSLVKLITKSEKEGFVLTAKAAVNVMAFIAALGQIATPLMASLNQFVGQLSLSHLQTDVLFIGLLVLILFASRNAVTKTVESLYKS